MLPINTLSDLGNQILKTQLGNLIQQEAAVCSGNNAEAVHDMRVATRRLITAINTFKTLIPNKTKKIKAKLRKLFHVLGEKRDLDIFSEFTLHALNNKSLRIQKLTKQKARVQKKILATIQSKYYTNLIASLELLKVNTSKKDKKLAKKQLQKVLDQVLEMAPLIHAATNDKTLHKLRIAVKKLRYVCEFFEPISNKDTNSLKTLIDTAKTIQDLLGEHQDAITGMKILTCYQNQFSIEEFIRIKKKYERNKEEMRHTFFKIWKTFLTDSLSKLQPQQVLR